MKKYEAEHGVPLDANWRTHSTDCAECKRFDADKPATIGLMCLEGAVLWKRENAVGPKRQTVDRPDNWASKSEVKAAMRYKE